MRPTVSGFVGGDVVARASGQIVGQAEQRSRVLDMSVVEQGLGGVEGQGRVGRALVQEGSIGPDGGVGVAGPRQDLGRPSPTTRPRRRGQDRDRAPASGETGITPPG